MTYHFLSKSIFKNRTASDSDLLEWLTFKNYINFLSIEEFKQVLVEINTKHKIIKFIQHKIKFGDTVTIESFNKNFGNTNLNTIRVGYGLSPIKIKQNSPYDPVYISNRDKISIDEAKIKIIQYKKNKATSKENFIFKYGEELGTEKYNEWIDKSLGVGHKLDGKLKSKLSPAYWLNKGYSETESYNRAVEYQHEHSPFHIEYYIKRNKSIEYAKNRIRKLHDKKLGIKSIENYRKLYPGASDYSLYQLIKFDKNSISSWKYGNEWFNHRISSIRKTMEANGHWCKTENKSEYENYRKLVNYYTSKNDLSLLLNFEKRGHILNDGYHLDHIYSISKGYINDIDPKIIGSIFNLRFIHWKDNVIKGSKCDITKTELIEKYENN